MKDFHKHLLPHWFYYISTLIDPWDLIHPTHVDLAQMLWDRFIKVPHTLALKGKPVFKLVSEDRYTIDNADFDFTETQTTSMRMAR